MIFLSTSWMAFIWLLLDNSIVTFSTDLSGHRNNPNTGRAWETQLGVIKLLIVTMSRISEPPFGERTISTSRWWFQRFFEFSPLFGEDFQFDEYFSDGLVQPPTRLVLFVWGLRCSGSVCRSLSLPPILCNTILGWKKQFSDLM